jgi:putative transposase
MRSKFTPLTDSQWQYIEKIIVRQRKSKHSLRSVIDAIFWLNYTGVQWRELDTRFPNWQTVYYHFRKLSVFGIWEQILDSLVTEQRIRQGREASPSLLTIDSQSIKTVQFVSEHIGIDGGKRVNGRKRSILVDKLGLPFALKVSSANLSDSQAGRLLVEQVKGKVPRLEKIAADGGYKEKFVAYAKDSFGWEVEIAQKPESASGFIPEKNRWQLERSFSWLNFRRRLFKEIEKTVESAEAMLRIFFISFIIKNL